MKIRHSLAAAALAVALLVPAHAALAEGETEILGAECVNISYPNFYQDLKTLAR